MADAFCRALCCQPIERPLGAKRDSPTLERRTQQDMSSGIQFHAFMFMWSFGYLCLAGARRRYLGAVCNAAGCITAFTGAIGILSLDHKIVAISICIQFCTVMGFLAWVFTTYYAATKADVRRSQLLKTKSPTTPSPHPLCTSANAFDCWIDAHTRRTSTRGSSWPCIFLTLASTPYRCSAWCQITSRSAVPRCGVRIPFAPCRARPSQPSQNVGRQRHHMPALRVRAHRACCADRPPGRSQACPSPTRRRSW